MKKVLSVLAAAVAVGGFAFAAPASAAPTHTYYETVADGDVGVLLRRALALLGRNR